MVSSFSIYGFTSAGKDIHQSAQLGILDRPAGSVCWQAGLAMGFSC